jgi:hypothetical protein
VSGKSAGEDGWGETEGEMSKAGEPESSKSERSEHHRPKRLTDWINPRGARKVHSLIDKVYKRKNLEIAWDRVRANHGAGGIDGESIEAFGEALDERLTRLHGELRTDKYVPRAVRLRLAHIATQQALRRVRASQLGRDDSFHRHSEENVFVKAGCGKTARPV